MRDILPDIFIAVTDSPDAFRNALAGIAKKSGDFTVRVHRSDLLSLCCTGASPSRGLVAQLITADGGVRVELRGEFKPDDPPSYEAYSRAAKETIGRLLKLYNERERTRYRLHITSKEKLGPKLPPQSAAYFRFFVGEANNKNLSVCPRTY
jgi:hypothetical protein